MIAFHRNFTQHYPGSNSKPYTQREHAGIWKTGILHNIIGKYQKNFRPGSGIQAAHSGGDFA
jgi:hypothetical protein